MVITNATQIDLKTLRTPKLRENEDILTFVSTFNPNNFDMFTVFQYNREIFSKSDRLKKAFENTKIIKSQRQAPNLKKILTRARFCPQQPETLSFSVSKCDNKRCGCCSVIGEGDSYFFSNVNKTFKVKANMDCTTKNLIYVLTCQGCKQYYIGHTNDLRARVRVHKQQIKDTSIMGMKVSTHIAQCARNLDRKFEIFPFYKMNTDDKKQRESKEDYFIFKFKSPLNAESP